MIGTAVLGAVLQSQLRTALHDQAVTASRALAAPFGASFVDHLTRAGAEGLGLASGQSGASGLAAGLPPGVAALMQRLPDKAFVNACAMAMRPSLLVPVAVFLFAALTRAFIARRPVRTSPAEDATGAAGHDFGPIAPAGSRGA